MAGVQSTNQQRSNYGPACKETTKKGAQEAWDRCSGVMKKYGYKLRASDTGARNCRKITGGTNYSLHSYFIACTILLWNLSKRIAGGLACDFNWQTNPYGPRLVTDMPRAMVDEILAIRTNSGVRVFGWGGYYTGNKDAMHFEIVCTPADLATGLAGGSPVQEEEDMAVLARGDATHEWWVVNDVGKRYVVTTGHAAFGASKGLWKGSNPEVWPQSFINEMPTVVTEDWLKALMGDLLNYRSGVDNAAIIDAINKHNPTVAVTDAQIGKIAAALKADLEKIKGLSDADKQALAQLTAEKVIEEIAS